ncbi:hydroxylamine reductase [Desulfotruncus alcoholivorax]|uniref:hydroxylamine reductase n=1 Tax=Desulfotruncus alcoholivorax TaxID=265477 RepID=UPI00048504E4|nr:hydroxylamine reductase [Desulfotruncus alcoholivorax]
MFCNQCEQTAKGTACTVAGVCGKTPEVSSLQDLLLHAVKGLSLYATEGRKHGIVDPQVNAFTVEAIFSTLTNVDFDPERFQGLIHSCVELREQIKDKVNSAGGKVDFTDPSATFTPAADLDNLIKQGEDMGLIIDRQANENIQSLQLILVFGIKGVSAYADHARILGQEDESIYSFIHEAMAALTQKDLSMDDWLNLVLKCGEVNLKTLELLDKANTDSFGHPVPTAVPLGHKKGKCILVSGHDLKDLSDLLEQTEGKDIYVYTHGEMLPAHGYPGLKKYKHLYGHFGTAWQNQKKEFPNFPGAILMTTNCLQEPQKSYHDNIFSTGLVGWPGVRHVENGQFKPVIEKALEMQGFPANEDKGTVMVGFGRSALFGVSDKIIDLVKKGAIKHFFLVAGCDGAKPGRNYFTEFVEKVPRDSVVLTLACGKFRFFDLDMGEIEGIPRLIDIGQCNDAYSAIQIALALAKAFNCGVNDLPLHMVLSWYEQKAVAILLTLLYLGIKDIRLGPSLPAFISPNVLDVLVKNFNIKPITTPDEDLAAILNKNH